MLGFFDRFRVDGPGAAPRYVNSFRRCVETPDPDEVEVPPLTQAAAQAIVQELLPIPVPGLSPDHSSLTGLDTWVWYEDDRRLALSGVDHDGDEGTPDTLGASLSDQSGPYSIAATVWIDEYVWDMGSGDVLSAGRPGSKSDPAHVYYYVTKDPATQVTASTVWRGSYTWSSPSGGGSGDLGSLMVTSAPVDFPVYEVRAIPAPDPDGGS